ncbi:MAG: TRAP transporter small permease [Clostridiales bacterium]|nr:TRAP transporter small permease [Clostridiales bacterium]
MSVLLKIKKVIYKCSEWLNLIGVALMIFMVLLVLVDILGRLLFKSPVPGTYELIEYAMVIVIVFAMAYCQVRRGHIDVSSLVDMFPKPLQLLVNTLVNLLAAAMMGCMAWQTFVKGGIDYVAGTTSAVLYIAKYPFVYLASFGFGLIALVFFIQMLTPYDPEEDQKKDEEELFVV